MKVKWSLVNFQISLLPIEIVKFSPQLEYNDWNENWNSTILWRRGESKKNENVLPGFQDLLQTPTDQFIMFDFNHEQFSYRDLFQLHNVHGCQQCGQHNSHIEFSSS